MNNSFQDTSFILKGDICWNTSPKTIKTVKDGYLVCTDGICQGVFERIPNEFMPLPLINYDGSLIVPGMVDLHIHAPQYPYRGLGMDLELLDWLQTYAFPEEAKYASKEYTNSAYGFFVHALKNSGTTRACIFATQHTEATIDLMDMLEKAGLETYVGKVNMDNDAPDNLVEKSAEASLKATREWLGFIQNRYAHAKPILTPRFLPSCTHELLENMKYFVTDYGLPVQSHLDENPGEVELVKQLFPETDNYADGYNRYNMFGNPTKTVMAHCVYCTDEEIELMKKQDVYVAHCPASNINLSSGIAPIRKYLDEGIDVGLGSDVAAGETESIFRAIVNTIQVSKLYWRLIDENYKPLTFAEAFYLATIGGGKFFGKVGSFEKGYEFDAVVLDDEDLKFDTLSVFERLQKAVYLNIDTTDIQAKYVQGRQIDLKHF